MYQTINIYNDIINEISKNLNISLGRLELENDIVICDERSFEGWFDNNELTPTTIYVIVSFEEGELWFGNTIVPITLVVYSEQGSFDKARKLITYFASNYNFIKGNGTNNATYIQSYSIPQMREEFAEEDNSFRAIFDLSGTFVYGENINGITSLVIDEEEITFLNIDVDFTMIPNSANLGDKNNRTTTTNRSGTFTMALSTPSFLNGTGSNFISKVDSIVFGNANINTTFEVRFVKGGVSYPSYEENETPTTRTLHLISASYNQEITGIPLYAIGLGE